MRKYRSFTDGLSNGSYRPVADLADGPERCDQLQKAAVGATQPVRREGRSPSKSETRQFDPERTFETDFRTGESP